MLGLFRQGAVALALVGAPAAAVAVVCAESPALPTGIAKLYLDQARRPLLVEGNGRAWRLQAAGQQMVLEPLEAPPPTQPPSPDALPDVEVASGRNDVRRAWLALPTERYAHGALGDAIEAGELRVETADGRVLGFKLDEDSVFEDRYPRIVDLDGDGRDEIVVVRSYLQRGAATAVFGLREDSVVLLAESEPIGAPNRWLNPAGFPDLDGDGRLEVAVVTTPHIGGTLRIYRFTGTSLEPAYAQEGFSNHVLGSRELALATVTDLDRDGRHELILPADGRQVIYQVALARDGSLRTWRFGRHADAVSTAIVAGDFDSDGRIEVLYGLSDGRLVFCSP